MNLPRTPPWIVAAAALALGLVVAYTALTNRVSKSFEAVDITGADWGRGFELTDHRGARRTLADFRGKVVMLTFGYTHCPDMCPTTLALLAGTLERLGNEAREVQVLFITVDPKRDTPFVFDPRGPLRLFIRPDASADAIVRDARALLAESDA